MVAAAVALSGCGANRSDFVDDAEQVCRGSAERIESWTPPLATGRGIAYGIDVFQEKDRLLRQLRELNPPDGDAATLRERWLDPAREDLEDFHPRLAAIRSAGLSGDAEALATEMEALRAAGTDGVDVAMLADYGLTDCADFFRG